MKRRGSSKSPSRPAQLGRADSSQIGKVRVAPDSPIETELAVNPPPGMKTQAAPVSADIRFGSFMTTLFSSLFEMGHACFADNPSVQGETRSMIESIDAVRTLHDLRDYVHTMLCKKENLVAEQFTMSEMQLIRRGRGCGLQFSIHGPRSVRLGAVWASDHNMVYFYDARGNRFAKERLKHRLLPEAKAG